MCEKIQGIVTSRSQARESTERETSLFFLGNRICLAMGMPFFK